MCSPGIFFLISELIDRLIGCVLKSSSKYDKQMTLAGSFLSSDSDFLMSFSKFFLNANF